MNKLNIVILAAGKGTRMHSDLPKVLHTVGAKPILGHVIDCAKALQPKKIIVVYGFGGERVKEAFSTEEITWVNQAEQHGTGHAVQQALPYLDADADTLILLGDVPLVDVNACKRLVAQADNKLAILSFNKADPTGYGRIVRNVKGDVRAIVEHKDATDEQRKIVEVNTGIMAMPNAQLKNWLSRISNNNAQREYYLTDIVAQAVADGVAVTSAHPAAVWEVAGVNSKVQLAQLERIHQNNIAQALLERGVTLLDPARIDVRGELICGRDVTIDVGCVFEGRVELGDGVRVGANNVLINATVAAGAHIKPFCHIEDAVVGAASIIGPYARLRPGTVLAEDVHIGNFVEVKNSQIAAHSKANHLAYIGDATIGSKVNIGAGTITCNYDGVNKFRTVIEDDAFIGSDSQLIAPVTVGKGATLGAGTTLSKDAPAGKLTVSRARQVTIDGWTRPVKIKK